MNVFLSSIAVSSKMVWDAGIFLCAIKTEGWGTEGLFHQKWSLEVLVVMNVLSRISLTDPYGYELAYGSLEIIKYFSW